MDFNELIIYGGLLCLIIGIASIIVEAVLNSKNSKKYSKYLKPLQSLTKLMLFCVIGCMGYILFMTNLQTQLISLKVYEGVKMNSDLPFYSY